jgi:SAM-dependent methyltransferase
MNLNRFKFIEENITGDLSGQRVLEVGSQIVRGSIRGYIESLNPKEYLGIDIVEGEGVDQILDLHEMADHFGENAFDLIISSDTMEHIEDLESASHNMHRVLKKGGRLVLGVPMMKTPYHGFPHDYWRFTLDDLKHLYKDMKVLAAYDTEGVCIILEKQKDHLEFDTGYPVKSILRGKPIRKHTWFDKKVLSLVRRVEVKLRKLYVDLMPSGLRTSVRKMLSSQ